MLEKIMSMLNQPAPVFQSERTDDDMTRVVVMLDTNGLQCAFAPERHESVISGDIVTTLKEAEYSAVSKAFKYLQHNHNIEVQDMSFQQSGVLRRRCNDVIRSMKEVKYLLEEVLHRQDTIWSLEFGRKKFESGVEDYDAELYQHVGSITDEALVFYDSIRTKINEHDKVCASFLEKSDDTRIHNSKVSLLTQLKCSDFNFIINSMYYF
uniref:Uncharacterized protein n=1 Tax=Arundo donax TaxID=35708 RepID=A0A0A9E679_ARUDO